MLRDNLRESVLSFLCAEEGFLVSDTLLAPGELVGEPLCLPSLFRSIVKTEAHNRPRCFYVDSRA